MIPGERPRRYSITRLTTGIVLIATGYWFLDDAMRRANHLLALTDNAFLWLMRLGSPQFLTGEMFGLFTILIGALLLASAIRFGTMSIADEPSRMAEITGKMSITAVAAIVVSICLCIAFLSELKEPYIGNAWSLVLLGAVVSMGCAVWLGVRASMTGKIRATTTWREVVLLGAIVLMSFAYIMHDTCHWRWAGTPDESHFFYLADQLTRGETHRFMMSEHGVFGYHPMMSSFFQVLFMRLFGSSCFGWKIASALSLAGALPGLYLMIHELLNRRAAFATILLVAVAKLPVGFAHFGYNNIQVLLPICWSLGLVFVAIRRSSPVWFYVTGVVAGLGFYTYYPARISILLVLFAYLIHARPLIRNGAWCAVAVMLLGFCITLIPVWYHFDEVMAHMVQQTAITGGQPVASSDLWMRVGQFITGGQLFGILYQWFLAITHGVWFIAPHHFQTNPVMDPISGSLAITGLWLAIRHAHRTRVARFLLGTYLIASFITGAISQYDRPPLTRLMLLSPFTAALAVYALALLGDALAGEARRTDRRMVGVMTGVLLAGAMIWNVVSLRYGIYTLHHGYGDGTTSEILQEIRKLPKEYRVVMVQRQDTYMECVDMVLAIFGYRPRLDYYKPFDERVERRLSEIQPPFALFTDLKDEHQIESLDRLIRDRFPDIVWKDTSAGRRWNLRYCAVPALSTP